jgi:hypothetical protein
MRNRNVKGHWLTKLSFPVLALASLAHVSACATKPSSPPDSLKLEPNAQAGAQGAAQSDNSKMQGAAGEAARQPLRDVGLLKKKIHPALSRIADPYAEPSGLDCKWINYELAELNAALGPESTMLPGLDKSTVSERGSRMAIDAATDFIRGSSAGLLPGRSLIRRISGAEKADMMYKAANERGMVRRGYLKGLAQAQKCS